MTEPDQPKGPPAPPGGAAPPPDPSTAQPPPPAPADARVPCPACGEPAEPGQELCLRCGARVGRSYRRPPGWRLPAALAAIGILLIGAGVGFAVADLTHKKSKKEKTVVPLGPRTTAPGPALTSPTTTSTTTTPTTPSTTTTAPSPKAGAKRGVVPVPGPGGGTSGAPAGPAGAAGGTTWPKGKRGYTIALASAGTRRQARVTADRAAKKDIPTGYLQSANYAGLPAPWVVFSGQYNRRADAASAVNVYRSQGFSAARVQQVRPRPGH